MTGKHHHFPPSLSLGHQLLLTAGGFGLLPYAPGTWASVATAMVITISQPSLFAAIAVTACIWALSLNSLRALRTAGVKKIDVSLVVSDEVIGMTVAMTPLIVTGTWRPTAAIVALAAFRLFDILKPFGIKAIDARNTPLAVILDDVAAGVLAAIVVSADLWAHWL